MQRLGPFSSIPKIATLVQEAESNRSKQRRLPSALLYDRHRCIVAPIRKEFAHTFISGIHNRNRNRGSCRNCYLYNLSQSPCDSVVKVLKQQSVMFDVNTEKKLQLAVERTYCRTGLVEKSISELKVQTGNGLKRHIRVNK